MGQILLASGSSAIIDIIALVVIIVFTLLGIKNGFTKTFFSMFGTFLSLLLSALLCKSTARFLENKFELITDVSTWVSGIVTKIFGDKIANVTIGEATQELLESSNFSQWLIGIVLFVKGQGAIPNDVTLNNIISPVLGYYIVLVIALVGLYVLFKILFFLVGEVVKSLYKFKFVGVADRALGAVIGLIHGIILIQLALMIVQAVPLGIFQRLMVQIENSAFTGFISKINVFGLIVKAFSKVNMAEIILQVISRSA